MNYHLYLSTINNSECLVLNQTYFPTSVKDKIKLNFKSHKKKIVKSTKFLDEVLDKQFVYKYFK